MKGLMGLLASAALVFTVFAEGGALPKTKYPPLNETLFQMYFKKVEPSQLKGNVFDWVRKECFLITAGSPASYNSMTAGWGGFGVLWGRDVASIYVRNTRYTYEFLEKEPYFTLSFYENPERAELMRVFGRMSGRNTDKIRESGFTPVKVPGGGVAYVQAKWILLCRRLAGVELTQDRIPQEIARKTYGGTRDFHKLYIGEILGVWIRK